MKKIIFTLFMAIFGTISIPAAESHVMEFRITGGGTDLSASVKQAMETNLVKLLTMMSDSQANGSKTLNFTGIGISQKAKNVILQMWKYQPLRVWADDDDVTPLITENLLNVNSLRMYQVRNIPVKLFPRDASGDGKYSQVSITFSPSGIIEDFNITISRQQYDKLIENAHTVQDVENRKMLAYWMDQLKMAYESKDIEYLNQLFDKDAVIITGVRATKHTGVETRFKSKDKFNYSVQNREQYISKMKRVFRANKELFINFKDQEYGANETVLVTDSNGDQMPRYYMVWCTQEWLGSAYSDVGRLFVLWDFKDTEQPVIMARVWTHPDDATQFSDADFDLNED